MKKAPKTKQILDEGEIAGPMMVYKPMTQRELEKATEIIAARKAEIAAEKKSNRNQNKKQRQLN